MYDSHKEYSEWYSSVIRVSNIVYGSPKRYVGPIWSHILEYNFQRYGDLMWVMIVIRDFGLKYSVRKPSEKWRSSIV